MIIDFEEKEHVYSLNGEIANISVTELLKKQKIAPDYSGARSQDLEESSRIGKEVHKDLEYTLNYENYNPVTKQGKNFREWQTKNIECGIGEQMLGIEYKGLLLCGTADVMAVGKNTVILGDHKNTAQFHENYVKWQVNLLDYMARKLGEEEINGKALNWTGATNFYCFHYNKKNGEMKVHELEKIPDEEIEELLDCEVNGEIYKPKKLVIAHDLEMQFAQAEQEIKEIEQMYKIAKERSDFIRELITKSFEEQGIKSWENENLKVTFVAGGERTTIDADKLKNEYSDVWEKCKKTSKTKSSIRVKVKKGEE